MRVQLVVLAALCAVIVNGGSVPRHQVKVPVNPLPPIWRKLTTLTREERAETIRAVFNSRSALENQVVDLINLLASSEAANPLLIPYITINITKDFADMHGHLDTLVVTGLSGLSVDTMKINPIQLSGNFAFSLPTLNIEGNYDIKGVIAGLLPIYGKGPFQIDLTGLKIGGSLQMGSDSGFVYIKSLVLDLGLEDFHCNFEMLLGSEELSDEINEMINDLAMDFFRRFESSIETALAETIMLKFNSRGEKMTLEKFVDTISGGGTARNECKPL